MELEWLILIWAVGVEVRLYLASKTDGQQTKVLGALVEIIKVSDLGLCLSQKRELKKILEKIRE